MESDNSPAVYQENNLIVYRASSIGGCLVALAAARQGREKQEPREGSKQLAIFSAGNDAEKDFFDFYPELAHYQQMALELHITPKVVVRSHADAIADGVLVEVKSQSDKEFSSWSWDSWTDDPLWVKYSWQVSAAMAGLGKHAICHLYRFNRDTKAVDKITLEIPFFTREDIFSRILEAEALATEEELKCTVADFFCSYPYLHVSDREVVEDEELEDAVGAYLYYKNLLADHEEDIGKKIKSYREIIDSKLNTLGRNKILLMSGKTVTRSEYDTKDHMVKGSHQVRLTIKGGEK